MSENCNFLYNRYKGNFTELREAISLDYDVSINCECGNEFISYTDSPMRCSKCGRVYQIRTILDIGDKIVSDEEYKVIVEEWEQEQKDFRMWIDDFKKEKDNNL